MITRNVFQSIKIIKTMSIRPLGAHFNQSKFPKQLAKKMHEKALENIRLQNVRHFIQASST